MTHLQRVPLSALHIEDESDFATIPHYGALKAALLQADAHYRLPVAGSALAHWHPVLLLNLAFWSPGQPDDVLEDRHVSADVVAHRAWHHLAHAALGDASTSVEGLMLGESIASAYDVYLIGRLLRDASDAAMLQSQVPAMTEVLEAAGLEASSIEALLERWADAPEAAFAQLQRLLYRVGVGLVRAQGAEAAAAVLVEANDAPMAPLLHHFELPTWTLHARAHAHGDGAAAVALQATLDAQADPLAWLSAHWLPASPRV